MALEIISKKPNGETINTIISNGNRNNRHSENFIVECNGREESGTVSIRIPNHYIQINLIERSVTIKDLGIEIRPK